MARPILLRSALIVLVVVLSGCQTLREVANLRNVRFNLSGVADGTLAGVDLSRLDSFSDLSARDVLNLTAAVSSRELPLTFNAVLRAENPAENSANARLVNMDWTLFLDGRETVSGVFSDEVLLAPGQPEQLLIPIQLDLVRFFDQNLRDLVDLALAVTGQGGAPKRLQLEVLPTVNTPLGPMRYPQAIKVVDQEVGS